MVGLAKLPGSPCLALPCLVLPWQMVPLANGCTEPTLRAVCDSDTKWPRWPQWWQKLDTKSWIPSDQGDHHYGGKSWIPKMRYQVTRMTTIMVAKVGYQKLDTKWPRWPPWWQKLDTKNQIPSDQDEHHYGSKNWISSDHDQSCTMSQIWQIYLCKNIGKLG